jgi:hypothetical protein
MEFGTQLTNWFGRCEHLSDRLVFPRFLRHFDWKLFSFYSYILYKCLLIHLKVQSWRQEKK